MGWLITEGGCSLEFGFVSVGIYDSSVGCEVSGGLSVPLWPSGTVVSSRCSGTG